MLTLLDNPKAAQTLGAKASRDLRTHASPRATGLRYATRLTELLFGDRK
jgi:hypothetical protein